MSIGEEHRDLHVELESISQEWVDVRAQYDQQDSEQPLSPQAWDELLTNKRILASETEVSPTLANAWHCAVNDTRAVFLDRIVPWAIRVIETFGIDAFPLDSPAPPQIERETGAYELGEATWLVTGTNDTATAGLRIILWAAARQDPQLCRRSLDYPVLVWRWISSLVEFENGICRPVREVTVWLHNALEDLIQRVNSHEDGNRSGTGDPMYLLERLRDGSVRVRFGNEEGMVRGRMAERLSLLIRQKRVHWIELAGDLPGLTASDSVADAGQVEQRSDDGPVRSSGRDVHIRDELRAAHERLAQLKTEIAEASHEVERSELEQEQRQLNNRVRRLTGMGSEQRRKGLEKIDRDLRRLRDKLLDSMPSFVNHLEGIKFDKVTDKYAYTPDPHITWKIQGF